MILRLVAGALLACVACARAGTNDIEPCARFKWDVSQEVALMKLQPQSVAAAVRPAADVPQLSIGKLYSLRLAEQAAVTFAAPPSKASKPAGVRAGLVRFSVAAAGRYRVSITSAHWIDVLGGTQSLPSVDSQGHVGCERPRKIVEFDLPAEHELTLQLSGSTDAEVVVAITATRPSSAVN